MKIQGIYGGTYVIKSDKDIDDAVEAEQDAHFDACFGVPYQPSKAEIEQDRLAEAYRAALEQEEASTNPLNQEAK